MTTKPIQPYPIRMPQEMRVRFEQAAKANGRSLHSEIIARLEASLDTLPPNSLDSTKNALRLLMEYISQDVLASDAKKRSWMDDKLMEALTEEDEHQTYKKAKKMAEEEGIPLNEYLKGLLHMGIAKKALQRLGDKED